MRLTYTISPLVTLVMDREIPISIIVFNFECYRAVFGVKVSMGKIVITFGTFDVFHVGHLRLLERARSYGDTLIVGVSTDLLNVNKKGRAPIYPEKERYEIVNALKCVDEVFFEESLQLKAKYLDENRANVLVMGDDWEGKFDEFSRVCEVVYLPRTPAISTTEVIEKIRY